MLKLNLTDDVLKEMKREMAVLMEEKNLERNLDNSLRVSHSTEVTFFAMLSYFAL